MTLRIDPEPAEVLPAASILVVEDDHSMRDLLKLHLSDAGYSVRVAEDAVEAGRAIFRAAPDLIILDVNLPYMSGLEFAALLQADRTIPTIPIIFVTANEHFALHAERLGADFLVKPLLKNRLLQCVARNLSRRPVSSLAESYRQIFDGWRLDATAPTGAR